jgi:ATP-dependent DNA helicase RecG
MQLSTSVVKLSQVGPAYQKRLKKLGIKTVRDLLYHFPHRYEDFSNIVQIVKAKINESCCIQGKIIEIENSRTWKKRMILTQAVVEDDSGAIKVVWFNQPYLTNVLKIGDRVCLAGRVTLGDQGLYLSNPAYEKLSKGKTLTHTGRIIPVYPETEGLSSRWLRFILKPLLIKIRNKIPDLLPIKIKNQYNLPAISQAIWQIHFPDSLDLARKAQERFSFEELFFISLFVLWERLKISKEKAISIPTDIPLIKKFVNSLPFKLTNAQKKSAWQILKDLKESRPMNRLLEGDVGSGKTVVATIAALNTMKAGFQVAFMAPTEILAKQHFHKVTKLLDKFKLNIGLLTGKETKINSKKTKSGVMKIPRTRLLGKLKEGKINLLIGTHALIQEKVKFENLALVILDEQHRFGVEQRAKLVASDKKKETRIPHLLSMTATPIPRTLALTVYGDLDLSLIDELPKGRKKIITKIIPPENREDAYDFIRSQVKKGRQVFVICPRIEPSNEKDKGKISSWSEVKAVKEEYEKLSKSIFSDLKVGMLHGKMKTKEKEKIMRGFSAKKIDILTSTSVIEVGIDIPNATVMMIEGAERFGLAQLHQFRGRVGRSKYQSFCLLFTDSPAKKTQQRLRALISSKNSFELAEKDLKIRGPGDFFGQRQWGIPDLAMSALKDISLVEKTRTAAREILREDPRLKKFPLLEEKINSFRERIHLE